MKTIDVSEDSKRVVEISSDKYKFIIPKFFPSQVPKTLPGFNHDEIWRDSIFSCSLDNYDEYKDLVSLGLNRNFKNTIKQSVHTGLSCMKATVMSKVFWLNMFIPNGPVRN